MNLNTYFIQHYLQSQRSGGGSVYRIKLLSYIFWEVIRHIQNTLIIINILYTDVYMIYTTQCIWLYKTEQRV